MTMDLDGRLVAVDRVDCLVGSARKRVAARARKKPQKVRYNFCTTSLRTLPEEHARLDDGPTLAARDVLMGTSSIRRSSRSNGRVSGVDRSPGATASRSDGACDATAAILFAAFGVRALRAAQ